MLESGLRLIRCFISIEIPQKIKKEIEKFQKQLPEFGGKITEFENLHLTLKFLGEIDEDKLKEVRKHLKTVKFNSFNCEIDRVGVFSEKLIRIVWMHLTNCDKLQKEIDEKLGRLFPKESKFMSHLTIARVKGVKNKKEFLDQFVGMKIPKINFKVDKFFLNKSVLTPRGPVYTIIEGYDLD